MVDGADADKYLAGTCAARCTPFPRSEGLMPRRITDVAAGAVWEVMPSGRTTQYGADEVSLEFGCAGEWRAREQRFARFAPRGAKAVEIALEDATDAALLNLLAQTQPAWTSPDGDYAGRTA